jgi:signal peptidase II
MSFTNAVKVLPQPIAWGVILVLFLLDQFSKWAVMQQIGFQEQVTVIPEFFSLTHVYNTGAAFSMMHDSNRFFSILSVVVFASLVALRRHFPGLLMQWGWILILSGILGNVTDRIFRGHVVDFLDFQFGSYHWPAFNVADSCICVAAGLFLISGFSSDISKDKKTA